MIRTSSRACGRWSSLDRPCPKRSDLEGMSQVLVQITVTISNIDALVEHMISQVLPVPCSLPWVQDLLLFLFQEHLSVLVVWILDSGHIDKVHVNRNRFDWLTVLSCRVGNFLDLQGDSRLVLQTCQGVCLVPVKVLSRHNVVVVLQFDILERQVRVVLEHFRILL